MIRDRFARRMKELAGEAASEERIIQEAAAMAVKADVREPLIFGALLALLLGLRLWWRLRDRRPGLAQPSVR